MSNNDSIRRRPKITFRLAAVLCTDNKWYIFDPLAEQFIWFPPYDSKKEANEMIEFICDDKDRLILATSTHTMNQRFVLH